TNGNKAADEVDLIEKYGDCYHQLGIAPGSDQEKQFNIAFMNFLQQNKGMSRSSFDSAFVQQFKSTPTPTPTPIPTPTPTPEPTPTPTPSPNPNPSHVPSPTKARKDLINDGLDMTLIARIDDATAQRLDQLSKDVLTQNVAKQSGRYQLTIA